MKKLTYGLLDSNVYLKRVDLDGQFIGSERERFTINIDEDLVKPLSRFEKAFFQQNKRTSAKTRLGDDDRELVAKRLGDAVHDTPFYIATMCAIGSLISLLPPNQGIKISYIAEAVDTQNENWLSAVKYYNNLFASLFDSNKSLRSAIGFSDGRVALACMLTGLQVVCDLTKHAYELHEVGRYIEAAKISNYLNIMRVDNMDIYRLLYSFKHPQQADLLQAMREHDVKYELRLEQDGEWVIVNKFELRLMPATQSTTVNHAGSDRAPDKNSGFINADSKANTVAAPEERAAEAAESTLSPSKALSVESDNGDTVNKDEHDDEVLESKSFDKSKAPGTFISKNEGLIHNPQDEEEAETASEQVPVTSEEEGESLSQDNENKEERYDAKRKKRVPSSAMAGAVFRAPKNKGSMPIDLDF